MWWHEFNALCFWSWWIFPILHSMDWLCQNCLHCCPNFLTREVLISPNCTSVENLDVLHALSVLNVTLCKCVKIKFVCIRCTQAHTIHLIVSYQFLRRGGGMPFPLFCPFPLPPLASVFLCSLTHSGVCIKALRLQFRIQPASMRTYFAILWCHSCLSRAAASASFWVRLSRLSFQFVLGRPGTSQ